MFLFSRSPISIAHILLLVSLSLQISATIVRVLVHESFVINVTVPEDATIDDVIKQVSDQVSDQVISKRTAIAELRLNGASLFAEDLVSEVVGDSVLTAIWGFKYHIHPPTTSCGDPVTVTLFHDPTNSLLVKALQTTHPWKHECPDITDVRVVLKGTGGSPSLYPTFMERGDWPIIDSLPREDSWDLYAIIAAHPIKVSK